MTTPSEKKTAEGIVEATWVGPSYEDWILALGNYRRGFTSGLRLGLLLGLSISAVTLLLDVIF